MARVLVTGYGGFTGHYVASALIAAGYIVTGLVHSEKGQASGASAIEVCDLLDRDALQNVVNVVRPDFVVHLAAIAFVGHNDVGAIYNTNVLGTRNLLEALAQCSHQPTKVLLASSANIYGNANVDPIHEGVLPAPANDYAVSKMAMEAMAKLWQDRLPLIIARPFNYTGVGQSLSFLPPKIVDHFKRKEPVIELGNLDVSRDFSDVRNVAASYVDLLQSSLIGETCNVCSGQAVSLAEIIDMVAEIAGYQIEVRVNPAFVRNNEVKTLRGSNDKLAQVIGNLDPIPLKETLRWMYQTGDS